VEAYDVLPVGFPDVSSTDSVDESKVPVAASNLIESSFDGQVLENLMLRIYRTRQRLAVKPPVARASSEA